MRKDMVNVLKNLARLGRQGYRTQRGRDHAGEVDHYTTILVTGIVSARMVSILTIPCPAPPMGSQNEGVDIPCKSSRYILESQSKEAWVRGSLLLL